MRRLSAPAGEALLKSYHYSRKGENERKITAVSPAEAFLKAPDLANEKSDLANLGRLR